jgi:hypothetical protein
MKTFIPLVASFVPSSLTLTLTSILTLSLLGIAAQRLDIQHMSCTNIAVMNKVSKIKIKT